MTGDARPVCPQCGAPLFQRHHGDLACVQHGLFYSAQVLDQTFGAGTAQRVAQLAARSPQAPRKCPDDRNGLSAVANASGLVRADACQRCGGVWMPLATLEEVERTTPAPEGASPSDARSLLGLAACRALVAAKHAPAR